MSEVGKSRNVLFRFDASPSIGLGHAMRCLAIAEQFVEHGFHCHIIASNVTPAIALQYEALGCSILEHRLEIGSKKDIDHLSDCIERLRADITILDGYHFSESYYKTIMSLDCLLVILDDTNDKGYLHCDVLVNSMPLADQLNYQHTAANAVHLLGVQYSLLRKEFRDLKPTEFKERSLFLVNFGGSDPLNLTLSTIKTMNAAKIQINPENVVILTGAGYQHQTEIKQVCQEKGYQYLHQCDKMSELLNKTRFVLMAAGSMIYEVAYFGIPAVLLTTAMNQRYSAKYHASKDWCINYDATIEGVMDEVMNAALKESILLWNNDVQLNQMHKIALSMIDGDGAVRLVDALIFKSSRYE